MNKTDTVLEFENVNLPAGTDYNAMTVVTLALQRGTAMVVLAQRGRERLPLAEAAEGLMPPASGRIRFLGEDWASLSVSRAAEARGRIGRVFDGSGWLSNLDVMENITLAERHHTKRSPDEIVAEAEKLARSFGLDGIPAGRPAWVPRGVLRRAEWVRAFLGGRALVLLEFPMADVDAEHAPALRDAVQRALGRGTAVVWITADRDEWEEAGGPDAARYVMKGEKMIAAGEKT